MGQVRRRFLWWAVPLAAVGILLSVAFARRQQADPERCPTGLTALGAHCCGEGQDSSALGCVGRATRCSIAQLPTEHGCAVLAERVTIPGGRLEVQIDDWDLQDRLTPPPPADVAPFAIDKFEVTGERWAACAAALRCAPRDDVVSSLPVTNVDVHSAATFCAHAGGRLPTSAEWLWAARGNAARRYPWGAFGLVCRRAAYGLVSGPCAKGASAPEAPGSRPDGASIDGVHDLSGNVAEWTLDVDGARLARGGSFRSTLAPELKSLAVLAPPSAATDVGFRCVYAP